MTVPTVLLLSDLHLGHVPQAADQAKAALDAVLAVCPEPQALILAGDLAETSTVHTYGVLRDLVTQAPCPAYCLMGNCDDRAAFRAAFPAHPVDAEGHVQCVVELGDDVLICLDTLTEAPEPRHSGRLGPARLAWLKDQLATHKGRRITVLGHHPLAPIGIGVADQLCLQDGAEVIRVLEASEVQRYLCGHLHRPASGRWGRLPFDVLGSTTFGLALSPGGQPLAVDPAAPPMGHLLQCGPDGPVLHSVYVPPQDGSP